MRKLLYVSMCCVVLAAGVDAQEYSCGHASDLPSLLECTNGAVLVLPEAKRVQLTDELQDVRQMVEQNTSRPWPDDVSAQDYGWEAAKPLLASGGVDKLVSTARAKDGRLRYGRAEALLAAGIRAEGFEQTDEPSRALSAEPGTASRLNDELLSLASSGTEWEQGDLAHAAASLATRRCDLARFERAMNMVKVPDALRYEFWRARITGDRSDLPQAIMRGANAEDTSHVRQALEGIAFLAELGDCAG